MNQNASSKPEITSCVLDPQTARILPWVIAVAFFMQMLDGTILNTALPGMARDLSVNPLNMQSVVIVYLLTVAVIIPISGWLSDKLGSKRLFLSAMVIFTLGSLACGLSTSLPMIVLSRVVQGVGGALMVPVGRLVVLRAYPRDQFVDVLSFITVPGLVGPLVGPTLGGFLIEYVNWHWIFFINIPVGILGILATMRYMPAFPSDGQTHLDKKGYALFGAFMLCVTLGLEGIGELKLAYLPMLGLIGVGILCLVLYVFYARHATRPLFSLSLFHVRNFRVGILGNVFARLGNGAMPFLMPLLLQVALNYSPMHAGMSMIPMTVGALTAKSIVTRLVHLFGYKKVLRINTVLLGMMIALFSYIDTQTNYYLMLGIFFVFGVINSTQFTAMNSVTLVDLSDTQASSGNSMLAVVMQLSMSMGVALSATLLSVFTDTASIASSFSTTFICLGIIAAASSLIFSAIEPQTGKTVTRSA